MLTYSHTSLSRPPISRQPRLSPHRASGRIYPHANYPVKPPPPPLALATIWLLSGYVKSIGYLAKLSYLTFIRVAALLSDPESESLNQ